MLYGISGNTRAIWDLSSARLLGYRPRDDAERYAADLLAAEERGELSPPGGGFRAVRARLDEAETRSSRTG